ncbi:dihydropteroate synthase [Psychrobacter sp. I-STPA10]|uniref:dihydropteroate synthase n=1 Tax=Psychrobacter sp. I-STPA10 TaxID=2585769 RepID=UPI003FA71406
MKLHALPKVCLSSKTAKRNDDLKKLDLSCPQIMGILNVTPDSFSDGGQFNAVDKAVTHAQAMIDAGASIIDVGGESTRPNATPVSIEQEMQRVVPVVQALRAQCDPNVWISIDTSTPEVMQACVEAGADIWNDVRALRREGALAMAVKLDIPVILMHIRGEPTTMDGLAVYEDVVSEVMDELSTTVKMALNAGVHRKHIIIDPGFGFAKGYEHHRQLLSQLYHLHTLNLPILFGVSRKRFLGEVLSKTGLPAFANNTANERDAVGMAAALLAVQQGASIIRTHNVAMTKQALALWQQIG